MLYYWCDVKENGRFLNDGFVKDVRNARKHSEFTKITTVKELNDVILWNDIEYETSFSFKLEDKWYRLGRPSSLKRDIGVGCYESNKLGEYIYDLENKSEELINDRYVICSLKNKVWIYDTWRLDSGNFEEGYETSLRIALFDGNFKEALSFVGVKDEEFEEFDANCNDNFIHDFRFKEYVEELELDCDSNNQFEIFKILVKENLNLDLDEYFKANNIN